MRDGCFEIPISMAKYKQACRLGILSFLFPSMFIKCPGHASLGFCEHTGSRYALSVPPKEQAHWEFWNTYNRRLTRNCATWHTDAVRVESVLWGGFISAFTEALDEEGHEKVFWGKDEGWSRSGGEKSSVWGMLNLNYLWSWQLERYFQERTGWLREEVSAGLGQIRWAAAAPWKAMVSDGMFQSRKGLTWSADCLHTVRKKKECNWGLGSWGKAC